VYWEEGEKGAQVGRLLDADATAFTKMSLDLLRRAKKFVVFYTLVTSFAKTKENQPTSK